MQIKYLAALCAALGLPAHAHITLEQKAAPAASTYKAVFRVGHGCNGSSTTTLTVFIPDDIARAKPQPKPGWRLDISTAPGTGRVGSVRWSGGSLKDSEYDEFIISMGLPAIPGKPVFRVLQECEQGQNDWAASPVAGTRPEFPAPVLDVMPAEGTTGHQH